MSFCGLTTRDNKEQAELARLIMDHSKAIVYGVGPAGTGKTIVTIATVLQILKDQRAGGKCKNKALKDNSAHGKIYYIREPIETANSAKIGFLPGDLDDKFGPYILGLKDNLEHLEAIGGQIDADYELKRIECIPPTYIRGRSLGMSDTTSDIDFSEVTDPSEIKINYNHDTFVILDEAQNASLDVIKTLLTRAGDYCKVILLGSVNQIDQKGQTKEQNAFITSYEKLKKFDFVGRVDLWKTERSKICTLIDNALSE